MISSFVDDTPGNIKGSAFLQRYFDERDKEEVETKRQEAHVRRTNKKHRERLNDRLTIVVDDYRYHSNSNLRPGH